MLISVHLPKTAGSSFLSSLEELYGSNLKRDYADLPINTPIPTRHIHALKQCLMNGVTRKDDHQCIHGHFLPLKYLFCKNAKFVTWVRDPIERMASHYYYWQRNYNQESAAPLHRKVIEEQWSLEQFCLCAELKNIYSQFMWGFPVSKFDFIGITEFYDTEIAYFSKNFLEVGLNSFEKNINPNKQATEYITEPGLLEKICEHHSKDIQFYQYALEARTLRDL